MSYTRQATCKDCGRGFFYVKQGAGKNREYCDDCANTRKKFKAMLRARKFRANKQPENSQSAKHDSPPLKVGAVGLAPPRAGSPIRLSICLTCGMEKFFGLCACHSGVRRFSSPNVIR